MTGSLTELARTAEIVVCAGSGGVGKTTVSAALAMRAASLGRRAAVVTIDPAKRLADALGLEELRNDPSPIDGPWDGELFALMLDTKTTFDALVRRYAPSDRQAEEILENRFYRNIAGALSGTQEYMAMEKLYELHTADFDLVVVDTPPTRHALDFLDAPGRVVRFLDHRLYRLLVAPGRGVMRAVNLAAQTFLRTVGGVVGGEVMEDAVGFFRAFDGMEEGFRERATHVLAVLDDPATAFVLVASPRRDTLDEASFFADRLSDQGIPVRAVVVNRMHPRFGDQLPEAARARAEHFAGTPLGGLYENLADLRTVAAREEEELASLLDRIEPEGTTEVVRIPFLESDVHDLGGLGVVADHLAPLD